MAAEIARARDCYRRAEPGIALLAPPARDCVRTALRLYSRILTEVEALGERMLSERAVVGLPRRLVTGGRGYLGALASRFSDR
jgi:phytoene synthase